MSYSRSMSSGSSFAGRATGQEQSFLKAVHRKAYPKSRKRANEKGEAKAIYINTPQERRLAGYMLKEDGGCVLEKRVIESKHLHRRFNAWGIDASLVETMPADGVNMIRIVSDSGIIEEATLDTFRTHGISHDFGFGPQLFLPRKYFCSRDASQGILFGGEL